MSPVALPTLRCEVAFGTGANPNAWTLDNTPFPVTLGPEFVDTYTNVSADVRAMKIYMGKSRELDQYQVGRTSVVLDNRARDFDPLNLSGPYVSGGETQVKPGRRLRCFLTHPTTLVEYQMYQGVVRNWGLDYTGKFDAVSHAYASDAMTELANTKVDLTTSAGASGTAMAEILAAAGIANREVDAGNSTLQAMTFAADALSAARVIEQSEQGTLYVEKDGTLTFLERHALLNETRHNTSQATFGAGNLSIHEIEIGYESDIVKNKATVTRGGGAAQEFSDDESIAEYGEKAMTLTGMASASDADALALATYLVAKNAEPAVRVKSITIMPQFHADLMTQALARRLLDRVTVQFAPFAPLVAYSKATLTDEAVEDPVN